MSVVVDAVNGGDPYVMLEIKHHRMLREYAERAMARLSDGDALNLNNAYGSILSILLDHVGETGVSEGAVDTLKRLMGELDVARVQLHCAVEFLRESFKSDGAEAWLEAFDATRKPTGAKR